MVLIALIRVDVLCLMEQVHPTDELHDIEGKEVSVRLVEAQHMHVMS